MTSLRSFVVVASSMVALTGCMGAEGNGIYREEQREVSAFDQVSVSGGLHAEIVAGTELQVVACGDDNLLRHIITEVKDGRMEVWPDVWLVDALAGTGVKVTVPQLSRVEACGGASATAKGISAASLSVHASGGSRACLDGSAGRLEVEASGGSGVDARAMGAEVVTVDISGGSNARVNVSKEVSGDVSGGSDLHIFGPAPGSPELKVNVESSGGSDITKE